MTDIQIDIIIQFRSILFSLTKRNLNESVEQITTLPGISSNLLPYLLLDTIYDEGVSYPVTKADLFVDLLYAVYQKGYNSLLPLTLLKLKYHFMSMNTPSSPKFQWGISIRLFLKKILTSQQIVEEIDKIIQAFPDACIKIMILTCIFALEINEVDPSRFNMVFSRVSKIPESLSSTVSYIKDGEWEKVESLLTYGYLPNTFEIAIRNDDLSLLQTLSSSMELNQAKPFSKNEFLSDWSVSETLTPLELSIYYGAVSCFKYCILNGAQIDDNTRVLGNNPEIICIIREKNLLQIHMMKSAIAMNLNDLFFFLEDFFFRRFFSIDQRKEMAQIAMQHSNLEVLQYLLKIVHDVNFAENLPFNYYLARILATPNLAANNLLSNSILLPNFYKNLDLSKCSVVCTANGRLDILTKISFADLPSDCIRCLLTASDFGFVEIIQYFLHELGPANSVLDDALIHASRLGNVQSMRILISSGADVNAVPKDVNTYYTPLIGACLSSSSDAVSLLLQQPGIDVNLNSKYSDLTPLMAAIPTGNEEIIHMLLKMPNLVVGGPALQAVLVKSQNAILQLMIDAGVDINSKGIGGWCALHQAAERNNTEAFKLLLSQETIDVNCKDNHYRTPLHLLAYNGQVEMLKILLERKDLDINATDKSQKTPLHLAVESPEAFKILASDPRTNLDARDEDGKTVLHYAAELEMYDILKYLILVVKVDPLVTNFYGWNAMHFAAENGSLSALAFLQPFYTEKHINDRTKEGLTPLHLAVLKEQTAFIELLLQEPNIDINIQTSTGKTPLHFAAMTGNKMVVKMLLDKKPKLDLKTRTGQTPLDLAKRYQKHDISKLLDPSSK